MYVETPIAHLCILLCFGRRKIHYLHVFITRLLYLKRPGLTLLSSKKNVVFLVAKMDLMVCLTSRLPQYYFQSIFDLIETTIFEKLDIECQTQNSLFVFKVIAHSYFS